jgi:DNA-binding transcriptional LysR family regulator
LSFVRVAERLNLTPAAISFQIKQIEGLCGFALFERVGRRVILTDAGAGLLEHAVVVLKALNDAEQRMMALKGISGGHVTIGLVSTAKYFVPHLLTRFQADHPGVSIHLRDGNRREINDAITRGDIDLAIMGKPLDDAGIEADQFAPHPSVLIAPASHPLAATGSGLLPLTALAGERFIVREEGSGTRALVDRYFLARDFSPKIVMTSSSNEMIKQAVMAGMGLALISRHTIGLELGLGLLTMLPVEGLPLMRAWFVAHRRAMPLLPVHKQVRAFLLDRGRAIIDAMEVSGGRIPNAAVR